MRSPALTTLALLAPLLAAGCSGSQDPRDPSAEPRSRDAREASSGPRGAEGEQDPFGGDPELARAVARALDSALAPGAARDALRVFSECFLGDALYQVEVFGNGVAVWNGERQFELTEAEVMELLRLLRDARFGAMREIHGEADVEIPIPQDGASGRGELSATRVVCLVSLRIGDVEKQSIQISKPPRSEELAELAESIFDLCRPAEAAGVTADSLDDGLAKIAQGFLAPESLRVLLHRKPETPSVEAGEPAFLLRIDGARTTVQPYTAEAGYGDPVELGVERSDQVDLAALLAENRPGELPLNLFADHYTDLVVEVLDRRQAIQARPFTGMTARTHGEAQERFDRIYQRLAELATLSGR